MLQHFWMHRGDGRYIGLVKVDQFAASIAYGIIEEGRIRPRLFPGFSIERQRINTDAPPMELALQIKCGTGPISPCSAYIYIVAISSVMEKFSNDQFLAMLGIEILEIVIH